MIPYPTDTFKIFQWECLHSQTYLYCILNGSIFSSDIIVEILNSIHYLFLQVHYCFASLHLYLSIVPFLINYQVSRNQKETLPSLLYISASGSSGITLKEQVTFIRSLCYRKIKECFVFIIGFIHWSFQKW